MNIAIVGTGYVGLVTGACFAKMGNNVWCVDIDEKKIEGLKNGVIPIYEPGLSEIVTKCHEDGNLRFVTDLEMCIKKVDIVFSAVGTPSDIDGSADLRFVKEVARRFGELITHDAVFVTKSTVPVGTAKIVKDIIEEQLERRRVTNIHVSVASNPEFLKEGSAVRDFLYPDRIVVGVEDECAAGIFKMLYAPFTVDNTSKLIITDIPSAEMIKYAANSMLATRISFMNEIANLCTKVGANIDSVRLGMGSDSRIGNKFLYAGCGYGGSCFPKDVKALINTGKSNGEPMTLLSAVEEVNANQKTIPLVLGRKHLNGYAGKNIMIWGLAFKPETDDIREAPAIVTLESLCLEGANVYAYDPVASENVRKHFEKTFGTERKGAYENLHLIGNKFDCESVDAILLLTEWNEFRSVEWAKVKEKWSDCKLLVDGRNIYERKKVEEAGIEYFGIGK